MNIFFTKWACQATSRINLTAIRVFSFAPQKPTTTNNLLPLSCFAARFLQCSHISFGIGLLSETFAFSDFHHTVSLVVSSRTTYLSLGERLLKTPGSTETAPDRVIIPF